MISWPVDLGPVVMLYIMVGACGRGSCSPRGSWEAKREIGMVQVPNISFKGSPPVT
jgi:hypothetical protein